MQDVIKRKAAELSDELSDVMKLTGLENGVSLLQIGERPDGLYLIESGNIKSHINSYTPDHNNMGEVVSVGLRELILDIPAAETVVTCRKCLVKFLPASEFRNLFETTEWFPRVISKILSRQTDTGLLSGERKRMARLEKLVEVSRIVNSTLDLNHLLKMILDTALEGVNGDRGTVYLFNEEKNELWSKVFEGGESVTIRLPLGSGIAGKVGESGEIMNIKDAAADPRFNSEIDKKTGYTTRTILCMPLRNKEGKMLGVFQLLNKKDGPFTADDEQFIETLSIQVSSALENARLYEQEQKKIELEKEMFAAAEVQKNLFPSSVPRLNGYSMSAINIPARMTSGDLYDFIPLDDNRLFFTLGDVSGKGLPASILMANLQSVLHDLPHYNTSPAYCVTRSNEIIHRAGSEVKFITLFFGLLDSARHRIVYTNAGHDHPYLFRRDETLRLSGGGFPVGILGGTRYVEKEYAMLPGDVLLLYSDGVNDAVNQQNQPFSEKRLEKLVSANRHLQAGALVDLVCREIRDFTGETPQYDDITLMIIKREE